MFNNYIQVHNFKSTKSTQNKLLSSLKMFIKHKFIACKNQRYLEVLYTGKKSKLLMSSACLKNPSVLDLAKIL